MWASRLLSESSAISNFGGVALDSDNTLSLCWELFECIDRSTEVEFLYSSTARWVSFVFGPNN